MVSNNYGSSIDKTISWLLMGILVIIFIAFTIMGMKNVQATAEKSKDGRPAEAVEIEIDISGAPN